jgi:hypothetical protein
MREPQRAKTSGTHLRATRITTMADRLQGYPGGGPETGPVHALVLDRGQRGQRGNFWWDLRLCIMIRTTARVFRAAARCQYSARDSNTQSQQHCGDAGQAIHSATNACTILPSTRLTDHTPHSCARDGKNDAATLEDEWPEHHLSAMTSQLLSCQ